MPTSDIMPTAMIAAVSVDRSLLLLIAAAAVPMMSFIPASNICLDGAFSIPRSGFWSHPEKMPQFRIRDAVSVFSCVPYCGLVGAASGAWPYHSRGGCRFFQMKELSLQDFIFIYQNNGKD